MRSHICQHYKVHTRPPQWQSNFQVGKLCTQPDLLNFGIGRRDSSCKLKSPSMASIFLCCILGKSLMRMLRLWPNSTPLRIRCKFRPWMHLSLSSTSLHCMRNKSLMLMRLLWLSRSLQHTQYKSMTPKHLLLLNTSQSCNFGKSLTTMRLSQSSTSP